MKHYHINVMKGIAMLALLQILLFTPYHAEAQQWSANWIWNSAQGPNNTWMCFRKKVTLSARPSSAIAKIAAENKYWLYVNDSLVVKDGGLDIRPSLSNTYYDEVDLAPYLKSGENIIAALVWHKGGVDSYSQRTVDYGGFLFQASLSGGGVSSIVSDNTWRAKVNPAFNRGTFSYKYGLTGTITFNNATFGDPLPNIVKSGYYRISGSGNAWTRCAGENESFTLPGVCDVAYGSEDNQLRPAGDYKWVAWPVSYDAGSAMNGWQSASFDDSSWGQAVSKGVPPAAPWNTLVPRTIPFWKDHGLLTYRNTFPSTVSAATTVTQELGINIQGTPYLKVNAPAGVMIRIILNDYYWQEYITKAGVQEFECFAWQNSSSHTVRYEFSNVTSPVTIMDLKFRQTSYNTTIPGSFSSSNEQLNTLWTKCKNTSFVCMRDIFFDCPNRERGQWWGDVSEQILYSFYLYDDASNLLARKGFRELMNTQKADGSLYTTAPGIVFNLPDQNMAAIAMLWNYYLYTGDEALLREIYPQTKKFIQQCASTANADGMLILQPGQGFNLWNWIDWGTNMDISEGSANTVCNSIYITLLDAAINIANLIGETADKTYYQTLQNNVKAHFNTYFWNSGSNAYVFHNRNGQQSTVIDDRSNAWAVLAGMADDAKKPGVLTILKNRYDASPYQEMYIELALSKLDATASLTRMKARYADMISSWSSTLWEEFPASNSNNHAWSAGPLYQLSAYALGVRPVQPAYATYVFQPQVTDLTSISAVVPSPKGNINVSYLKSGNTFTQTINAPSNAVAIVGVPKHIFGASITIGTITANGTVIWQNGSAQGNLPGVSFFEEDSEYIKFNVQPDQWTFVSVASDSAPVVLYDDCSYAGNAFALPVGDYNLADLNARGILNDRISSLRVKSGYKAILYRDINYGGGSLVKTADDDCLVNDGWNDALSSLSIQLNTSLLTKEADAARTGEQTKETSAEVTFYPNPVKDILTIHTGVAGYQRIFITDMSGKVILSKSITQETGDITIDTKQMKKGLYYVCLQGGKKASVCSKVVIE